MMNKKRVPCFKETLRVTKHSLVIEAVPVISKQESRSSKFNAKCNPPCLWSLIDLKAFLCVIFHYLSCAGKSMHSIFVANLSVPLAGSSYSFQTQKNQGPIYRWCCRKPYHNIIVLHQKLHQGPIIIKVFKVFRRLSLEISFSNHRPSPWSSLWKAIQVSQIICSQMNNEPFKDV
jgi:hypothetical protein